MVIWIVSHNTLFPCPSAVCALISTEANSCFNKCIWIKCCHMLVFWSVKILYCNNVKIQFSFVKVFWLGHKHQTKITHLKNEMLVVCLSCSVIHSQMKRCRSMSFTHPLVISNLYDKSKVKLHVINVGFTHLL